MAVPKSSQYILFFNNVMADLHTNGKIKALKKKWTVTGDCKEETMIKPINVKKIVSSFIYLLVGIIFSLTLLVIELIRRRNVTALNSVSDIEVIDELTANISRIHQLRITFFDHDVNEIIMEIGIAYDMEEECLEIIA